MNPPHTHPRATEIQFNVNGTLRTGMITENGARFIMTELNPGGMTIFPQGSIHFQVNEGCGAYPPFMIYDSSLTIFSLPEPAMFVAGFNSEDPGVVSVAQRCE
jgi:hypothetical protein